MKNNSKEKPTIKESINRILMILSYLNLILLFPFTIEVIGLLTIFKDNIEDKSQIPLMIIGIIYYVLASITSCFFFTKDNKNKGINLIKNIIKLLIITSVFLIISGIIFIFL